MIRENRACVTICPFPSFRGEIEVCQVVFKGKEITSRMVYPNIPNFVVSQTENGVQDKNSLEAVYRYFNKCVEERDVKKPILITSDGHSARFSHPSLILLFSNRLEMFLGPSDTIGLTQLLDQINQSLYSHYQKSKKKLFTNEMTIDTGGFMAILADILPSWTTSEAIQKSAKVFCVSIDGLNVNWMSQEEIEKAEMLIASNDVAATPSKGTTDNIVDSQTPEGMRRNSNEYLKFKLQKAEERNELLKAKLAAKN